MLLKLRNVHIHVDFSRLRFYCLTLRSHARFVCVETNTDTLDQGYVDSYDTALNSVEAVALYGLSKNAAKNVSFSLVSSVVCKFRIYQINNIFKYAYHFE